MKLIRKQDITRSLFDYMDGEATIGECIDNCETFDVTYLISDLMVTISQLDDIWECEKNNIHVAGERLGFQIENIRNVLEVIKEWGDMR